MRRIHQILIIFLIWLSPQLTQAQESKSNPLNIIHSNGLMFTEIEVNNHSVLALIDFGDPHVLMLSYSFANSKQLDLVRMNERAYYINGNSYDLYEGTAQQLKVGKWKMDHVDFASSPCEIESLNENVDIKFDAVIGWGYFSQFYLKVDYASSKFVLSKEKPSNIEEEFSSNYTRKNGYLELGIDVEGSEKNFILDTGSPISLIDRKYHSSISKRFISTELNGHELNLKLYSTDLSLLTEMKIYGMLGTDFFKLYALSIDPFQEKIFFQKSIFHLTMKTR